MKFRFLLPFVLVAIFVMDTQAQRRKRAKALPTTTYDASLYHDMKWRNIGPFRGGRSTAAVGVPQDPNLYYFGGTGGGVWKTTDAGAHWTNISDGFFKSGSVGAIAVAESDPNVIYVGMGEATIRGVMTSTGDGIYKSVDAGETWTHMGLDESLHISAIQIHPSNPDLVYVSVQGNPYKDGNEKGIYRSRDGGENWTKIHSVSPKAGPADLSMDMRNPRILYASYWQLHRTPWIVNSGGEHSGIYKSKDGGDTWEELTDGLPEDIMGKIGVSVSRANPQVVYAIIEAEKGGLYRSNDGGKNWKLINSDRILRARSWYYMHIFTDPKDENTVWVLNAPVMKSSDGGKTFAQISSPHGDNHDLWINPNNPANMINANDGGANISFNGGATWSTQGNQPTAQFYRVNVDNQYPYWVYGGQQDNSSVAIPSQASRGGIALGDWIAGVGGCESAYCAFDPDDPSHIYAGCYRGIIDEWDRETRTTKDIMAYPIQVLGTSSKGSKYRFNWNAPILVSKHDSKVIYHAAQKLLKSEDRGNSWIEISPDLTRNDTTKQGFGGGPITREGAGGEVYGTIMYVAESAQDAKTIWAGSDDGLIHITRNGGESWSEITPPGTPESIINCIELSSHDEGTAYAVATPYKLGDFGAYIYKTTNYGSTWTRIDKGIPYHSFARVVREDPERKGLLYAGTERGLYASFDSGNSWTQFQQNLPVVAITDLMVAHGDLIAATMGRAFWILDDLSPLYALGRTTSMPTILPMRDAVKSGFRQNKEANKNGLGMNPYSGVTVNYLMPSDSEDDTLDFKVEVMDMSENVLRTFQREHKDNTDTTSYKKGMNTVQWDMTVDKLKTPKGLRPFGNTGGHSVAPGSYKVRLTYDGKTSEQIVNVTKDPRYDIKDESYAAQASMIEEVDVMLTDLYDRVIDLYRMRGQIKAQNKLLEDDFESDDEDAENPNQALIDQGEEMLEQIKAFEELLVQPEQKTFQDVINFENKLDANLMHIQGSIAGDNPPVTSGQRMRFADLKAQWMTIKGDIDGWMNKELVAYNAALAGARILHVR